MIDNRGTMHFHKIIYLSILTALASVASSGALSRPQKYAEHHLVDEDICHPLGVPRASLRLSKTVNSGLIISPSDMFDHWNKRISDLKCKFVIRAPKGEHLFGVIQNISFRKNGSECLDYVKFRRKDRSETGKFCGQFDRKKINNLSKSGDDFENSIAQNSSYNYGEFDSQGEIETTIFVSKIPLKKWENLNLTIVYTPYKDCEKVDFGDYRTMKYEVCLWREYFCDGVQNCFADICMDEDYCSDEITGNGTGTNVTIGAVTTILLCFVIFLMGLWICRRHKKLCWSSDCAGPSSNDERISVADRDSGNSNNPVANAPMIEVAVLPSTLDKDLPPSYDSLFPNNSNPSTT